MRSENAIPIPHELFNSEVDGYVTSSEQVKDYHFNKSQEEINQSLTNEISNINSAQATIQDKVGELEGINADERLSEVEELSERNKNKIDDINSVVHAEFDDVPTEGSHKFVDSDTVYRAIRSNSINNIKITELDSLWTPDLYKTNTPARYNVITPFVNNNYKLGTLFIIADDEGHKLMQVFITSLLYDDNTGELDVSSYDNPIVMIYRYYNYPAHSTSLDAAGWTRWNLVNKNYFDKAVRYDIEQNLTILQKYVAKGNLGIYIDSTPDLDSNPNHILTAAGVASLIDSKSVNKVIYSNIDTLFGTSYINISAPKVYSIVLSEDSVNSVGNLIVFFDSATSSIVQVFITSAKLINRVDNTQTISFESEYDDTIIIYRKAPINLVESSQVSNRVPTWSNWKYINHHLSDGVVKYNEAQTLMYEDKTRALNNLGITIDDDTSSEEAITIDGDSPGIPTTRYIYKVIQGMKNIIDYNINNIHTDLNQTINNLRGDLVNKCNDVYDTLDSKINDIYINNGIRIFDDFIPANRRVVVSSSTSESRNGDVLWYPLGRTFIYRVATGSNNDNPTYTFYSNWHDRTLYIDRNGVPYDSLIYICGANNYRVIDGNLSLIEDSSSIITRLQAVNEAIVELQNQMNDLTNELEDYSVDIKEVSYSELVELSQLNALEPGRKYRIIDYCSWFNLEYVAMAPYVFDLIVEAINTYSLNPKATAVRPKYRDDMHFFPNNVNVSDFQIWYNLMSSNPDIEKYAPYMCDNINQEEMVIIINNTKEIFYCNSFNDNKLHYQGKTYDSDKKAILHPYKYQTDDYRGAYAVFNVNPDGDAFKPSSTEDVISVFRAPSLDDADDFDSYVETRYKANQITVLRQCGYIYKMIDDNGNEAPYDFKNMVYQMHKFNQASRGSYINDSSLEQEITAEADATENGMHYSIYGFPDTTIKAYSGYMSDYIMARYISHSDNPIIGIDAQYAFTFNKFIANVPMDFTIPITPNAKLPKNNKVCRGVSIQIHNSFNGNINNNILYSKTLVVYVQNDFKNVICDLNNSPTPAIIVNSNSYDEPVTNENIINIEGFGGENQLMVHSNRYHKNKELIDYIKTLIN